MQLEIIVLEEQVTTKEHQWSATKEVYHREYGPIAEENNAAPVTEVKGKKKSRCIHLCWKLEEKTDNGCDKPPLAPTPLLL